MRLTKKQLKKLMIDRYGRRWNTKPERLFNEYQQSRGLNLAQNVLLPFAWNGQKFTFQLDFARPTDDGTFDIDIEIDGKGHKEKWDHWKDQVKSSQGIKVIHIDARLCERKFWSYLDQKINEAILSKEGVVYIHG